MAKDVADTDLPFYPGKSSLKESITGTLRTMIEHCENVNCKVTGGPLRHGHATPTRLQIPRGPKKERSAYLKSLKMSWKGGHLDLVGNTDPLARRSSGCQTDSEEEEHTCM